jgi:hypothetical protein
MKLTRDENLRNRRRSREKEMLTNAYDGHLSAIEEYGEYFEGSPSYVTYYQLDLMESTQDQVLENVNELFGQDSPKKYKLIEQVPLYDVNINDITTEINDYGLISEIVNEAVIRPNTIRPYVGDVFIFDMDNTGELDNIAFRITDVQIDKASTQKFYRITYKIEETLPSIIDSAVALNPDGSRKEYEISPYQGHSLVEKGGADLAYSTFVISDAMIRTYISEYYDEDMDLFIDPDNNMWCTYLHKFMRDNDVISFNERSLMEEIYLMKFHDRELVNLNIFDRKVYRKSIFRNLEVKSNKSNIDYDIFSVGQCDSMNSTHILPFFNSSYDVNISVGFNGSYHSADEYFFLPEADLLPNESRSKIELDPFTIKEPWLIIGNDSEAQNVSLAKRIKDNSPIVESWAEYNILEDDEFLLQNIIILYLNNSFSLSDELLDKINNYDYTFDIRDYYLIPMVIYILKQTAKNILGQ